MTTNSDEKPEGASRRNALKIVGGVIVATTATPASWKKPIVNSVVLPTHASTSNPPDDEVDPPNKGVDVVGNASDIRLKTDVSKVSVTPSGFQLYSFQYTDDLSKQKYVGVMAQDLLDSHPEALIKRDDGYYWVRYDCLGLKMATLEDWDSMGLESVTNIH